MQLQSAKPSVARILAVSFNESKLTAALEYPVGVANPNDTTSTTLRATMLPTSAPKTTGGDVRLHVFAGGFGAVFLVVLLLSW